MLSVWKLPWYSNKNSTAQKKQIEMIAKRLGFLISHEKNLMYAWYINQASKYLKNKIMGMLGGKGFSI